MTVVVVVVVAAIAVAGIVKCSPEQIPELFLAFAATTKAGGPPSVGLGRE